MGSSNGWRDESGGPSCGTTSHPGSFGLIASYWPRQIGRMRDDLPFEPLLPCVLDPNDVDQLLERLRSVHGAPRYDIAPEITKATRAALRLQTAGGGTLTRNLRAPLSIAELEFQSKAEAPSCRSWCDGQRPPDELALRN